MSQKLKLGLGRFKREKEGAPSEKTLTPPPAHYAGPYDDTPIPRITFHAAILGIFVSMGGFIFGYDTGQISGFLGMPVFLESFGQRNSDGSGYHFSNVRSGLIVALVSKPFLSLTR